MVIFLKFIITRPSKEETFPRRRTHGGCVYFHSCSAKPAQYCPVSATPVFISLLMRVLNAVCRFLRLTQVLNKLQLTIYTEELVPVLTFSCLKPQISYENGHSEFLLSRKRYCYGQWRTEGGLGCSNSPPPEIPKTLQNHAILNPVVKTVKNC